MLRLPPRSTLTDPLFPYTPRFRSAGGLRRSCPTSDPGPPHRADRSLDARTLAQRRRALIAQPVLSGAAVPVFRHHARRLRGEECRSTGGAGKVRRSEEHTSELQSLMRISYAVFCLKKKNTQL